MIIGLGHQAQVGKDTVAEHLVDYHGFVRLAFADALKRMAYDINPQINGGDLRVLVDNVGWERSKQVREVRTFLQNLGVAARDHIDSDVWVRIVLDQASQLTINAGKDVVITDVRFPNEYVALDTAGAYLVKVVRPGVESNAGSHVSEKALADYPWPYTLLNNGSLEDLHMKVDAFLTSLRLSA